jgi:hypothetical protein
MMGFALMTTRLKRRFHARLDKLPIDILII